MELLETMTKPDLKFSAFLQGLYCRFRSSLLFRCKFSFHEVWQLSQVFQRRDFPEPINFFLLAIVTDVICINNRSRQISLIMCAIFGKGRLSSHIGRFQTWKAFFCTSLLLYFIKQLRINVAVRLLRNRSQNTSSHGKNIDETPSDRLVCHFSLLTTFWRHLWSITGRLPRTTESICSI